MARVHTVVSLLNNLGEFRNKLAFLAAIPEAEFLSDFTKVESAKHLLQVSVETCLDIAHHIVAEGGYRTPEDSYDAFVVLKEERILPDDFLPVLRQMVSFRNRVVHMYWKVDDQVVYRTLQDDLEDLDRFASLIADYLQDQSTPEGE